MALARKNHVTHIASGDLWAGAEVQLFTLAKALVQPGKARVSVVLMNHGELEQRLIQQGIPVTVMDETTLNGFQILWHLTNHLKKHKPDVVHTHRIKENILGGLAALLAGNIPSLRTVHGAPEHSPGWAKPHKQLFYTLDWLTGRFLQRKIIAVSKDLAALLGKEYPARKIAIIENGVDIEALIPLTKVSIFPRPRAEGTPIKIGLVGRLVPIKRVDLFIKIAHHLKHEYPGIPSHFHIYGDGPLRNELETLCTKLDLEGTVHFEGHSNNIHQEIANLDVLLITSDHEGLPMTLLEAMALGTPVISHSVGGIQEVLNYGEYGSLIKSPTTESFSTTIIEILKNSTQTMRTVTAAQNRINEHYSSRTNAAKYWKLYQELTNSDGAV